MNKQQNRIRWVSFEGDCYVSLDDIGQTIMNAKGKYKGRYLIELILNQLRSIRRSWINRVPGMDGEMKKHWTDIMNSN